MAPSPSSCDAAGNAQALPSVIEPKPRASLPSSVRTRQVHVQDRDAIDRPATELVGRPVVMTLELVRHVHDSDVVRP